MILSWLSKLFGRKFSGRETGRRLTDQRRWKRVRLYAEVLEDRFAPALVTWDGASTLSSNWTDGANWQGNVAPNPGDSLYFPPSVPRLNNTNDFTAGTAFASIQIAGAGYTLGGNQVKLSGGVSAAGTNTLNLSLQLTAGQGIAETASGTLTLGAAINLNGNGLTLDSGSGAIQVTGSGTLSGSGSLTKAGSGTLTLANADTYTGTTAVTGGTLIVQNAAALGSGDGTAATATSLSNNGTLSLQNSITISNHLLSATSGTGNLVSSGNDVWTGNVSFGNPSSYPSLLFEPNFGSTLEIDGAISNAGNGYLDQEGSGRTILKGTSSFSSSYFNEVNIYSGTLEVDNSLTLPSGNGYVYVSGGTLAGTGTITSTYYYPDDRISMEGNAQLSPGTTSSPGTLTVGSSLHFLNSNNAINIRLNGASAGQYDEVNVQGDVSFISTALNVSLGSGFTPAIGNSFTILHSTSPIVGTFNGLVQGSLFTVGSTVFQISYTAGMGDDIVLTAVAGKVWNGSSTLSSNWSDATNWVGGVAPVTGDNLLFPSGAARLSNTNDFTAGMAFGSILVSGASYTLGGNQVKLSGGVSAAGTNTLNLSLQLTASQGIAETTSGTLTLGAAINLNGNGLTLDSGSGAIQVSGSGNLSGSGSLTKAGSGSLTLANADTYTGTTAVTGGTLIVQNAAALGSGDGTPATATSLSNNGTLLLQNSITISNHLLSATSGTGNLASSGNDVWTGNVSFGSPAYNSLYFEPGSGSTLEIDGTISAVGAGYLYQYGSGRTILKGTSSFSSSYFNEVNIYSGTLEVDNSLTLPSGNGYVYVSGGTLAGTGTITSTYYYPDDRISMEGNAQLSPGTTSSPGTLTVGSSLHFLNSNNAINIRLNGASAGQYDEVNVQGDVSFISTALNVSLGSGFTPAIGNSFTILHSTSPIVGTFNGLVQGSLFTVGSTVFQISYTAGMGDDIVLTAVAGKVWNGSSTLSSNWSDATNWVGGVAPVTGDNLLFPSGAARLSNTNDFTAGMAFGSILVSGTGYTLGGDQVKLSGGVSAAGTNTLNLPLQLTATEGIAQTVSGTLTLGAAINLNGNALTLDSGSGAIQVSGSGTLSGSGSLTKAGSGTLTLANADSYTGTTAVTGGTLIVQNAAALGSGDGTAATATSLSNNGTLSLQNSITISNHLLSATSGTGNLASSGNDVWTGNVSWGNLSSYSYLYFEPGSGSTLEIDGTITSVGNGYLYQYSSGRTILKGTSSLNPSYGTFVFVYSGTLEVDNSLTIPSGNGYVYVSGGTLAGTGTITSTYSTPDDRISMQGNAQLSPGTASSPATLTVGTSLHFLNSNNAINIRLNGASAGQYDEVNVQGDVSLNGAALNLYLGFKPSAGQTFTILHSTSPIVGTFSGLSEGSNVQVGTNIFKITYMGGAGDDIVLTAQTSNPPVITSNGGNNLFTLRNSATPGKVEYDVNGGPWVQLDATDAFQLNGADGNDTLTLDFTNGYFSLPSLSFSGGGSGTLKTKGGSIQTITETLTGSGSGAMLVHPASGSDLTVTYSGVLPVDTTATSANNLVFNINQSGITDAILDNTGVASGDMTLRFTSHSSVNQLFADPSGALTIKTSGGNSRVQLGTPDVSFGPTTVTLNGSAGDTFKLTAANPLPSASNLTLTAATLDLNGNSDSIGALNGTGVVTDSGAASTLTVTGGGSFSGNITGNNTALTVGGTSQTLTLSGNNSYKGTTTVSNSATLKVGSSTALGNASNVSDSGTLDLNGNSITIGALNGGGSVIDGAGPATLTVTGGGTFNGNISGANTALTVGGATQTLMLSGSNTFGGTTTVNSTDTLKAGSANTLSSSSSVSDSGTLDLNGFSNTINGLSGGGTVDNRAGAGTYTLTVGANGTTSTFTGIIQNTAGTVALIKAGSGTLILQGASTYTGATTVSTGTLEVDGSLTSSVGNGGTLDGTGTITGNVSGSGGFSPGDAPGTMTINGNFTPTGTVTFEVDSPYTTAGTDYDQYLVSGTVDLSGATLNFLNNIGGVPAATKTVTLIRKTSAGATVASASPPDGSFLTTSGLTGFQIAYNGGHGSDVVLAYNMPTVSGTTPSLTGGTLAAGTTSLQVQFNKPVVGAGQASNYALQSAGPDGLLGTTDDVILPLSASYTTATNTATLTFSALPPSIYRLTASDNITDTDGHQLDGAGTGIPGTNYVRDFVVMATPTTPLTSPNGFTFDPDFGGFGAGQLVQGTNNAFDGLNRLQVGGADFAPAAGYAAADVVTAAPANTFDNPLITTVNNPVTVSTPVVVDAAKTGIYDLRFVASAEGGSSAFIHYIVDGVPSDGANDPYGHATTQLKYVGNGSAGGWHELVFEVAITLTPGTHTVGVQVTTDGGTMLVANPYLELVGYNKVGGVPAADVVTAAPANTFDNPLITTVNNPVTVSTPVVVDAAKTGIYDLRFVASAEGGSSAFIHYIVDGVPSDGANDPYGHATTQLEYVGNGSAGGWHELVFEVAITLTPGTHTVGVQVTTDGGTMLVANPYLELVGYNKVGGVPAADVVTAAPANTFDNPLITTVNNPVTVSTPVVVDAANTGVYDLRFVASAEGGSSAFIHYIVDGVPSDGANDPYGHATTQLEYVGNGSAGGWHELVFDVAITLTPGTHIVGVEVTTDSGTMFVANPYLELVGYNNLPSLRNNGQSVSTISETLSGLNVSRTITVPNTGSQDFARTVDYFQNPTGSPITTTVHIVGNLGSDAATRVFATSSGDSTASTSDEWVGTDGGPGTTAVISIIHGPHGLLPTSEDIVGDNIEWTYSITVQPGQTLELATFSIQASSEANAIAEANVLVTPTDFGGQAEEFLNQADLAALANFQFPPLQVSGTTPAFTSGTVATGTTSLQVQFNKAVIGADQASNYQLQSVGPDGLLGTADDVIVPLSAAYNSANNTATLTFSALPAGVYRLTISDNITDTHGNPLDGAGTPDSNFVRDFVVNPSNLGLNPTFGTNGAVTTNITTYPNRSSDNANATVVQPDGKVIVAGVSYLSFGSFALARYNADGSLDSGFGSGGVVSTSVGANNAYASAVALQSDGKIVAAGYANDSSGNQRFALVRYNSDGSVDTSFGNNGQVMLNFGGSYDYAQAVTVQADGKILVAGYGYNGSTLAELARLNSDGSLDSSFGTGGMATTNFGNNSGSLFYAVTVQSDGKIIAAAQNGSQIALARYTSTGSLDSSFGSGGVVITSLAGSSNPRSVAVQSDGKIVVGAQNYTSNASFEVVRFNSDGSLDTSFGSGGSVITTFADGATSHYASGLALLSSGQIVVGGYGPTNSGNNLLEVARYNSAGSLDSSFGSGGEFTAAMPGLYGFVQALAVASNGSIILAGGVQTIYGTEAFLVARVTTGGALDGTFGTGGLVTTSITTYLNRSSDNANATVVQPDGKVIVAGATSLGFSSFALARYNADGSLDSSFGSGGVVSTSVGTNYAYASAVALQSDGKIVAAGYANDSSNNQRFAVVRYNSDGSLDTSFGSHGQVMLNFGGSYDIAQAVTIQSDGKILVAGYGYNGSTLAELARLNTDGSLDSSFGTGGMVTTNFGNNNGSQFYAVTVQSDGKILAAAQNGSQIALARYTSNGNLDSSFGSGGAVLTSLAGSNYPRAVAVQSDGKIVVGAENYASNASFQVVRFNSDGSLDSTFGSGGSVTTAFADGASYHYASGLALLSGGQIVVGGYGQTASNNNLLEVARYNSDGSLDSTFGSGGEFTAAISGYAGFVQALAVASSGTIILAGSIQTIYGPDAFLVARITTAGALDGTFGTGGQVTTSITTYLNRSSDNANATVVQPDSKVIVAGVTNLSLGRFALARYNADGSLDSSFGSGGVVSTSVGANNAYASAVALQSDGKIVAAGYANDSSNNQRFAVVRYNSDGSLDTSFGSHGQVMLNFGGSYDIAQAVTIQSDGKILVAGYGYNGGTLAELARLNSDGSLDSSFGTGGMVTTNFGNNNGSQFYAVTVQSDGKIIAAGQNGSQIALARYTSNGNLDSSFGSGGMVVTNLAGSNYPRAVAVQSDGKIVVGAENYASNGSFEVVRFNSDGSLDTSFGSGGSVTTAFADGASYHYASGLALLSSGQIVVGGYGQTASNNNLLEVARYNSDGSLDSSFGSGGEFTTAIPGLYGSVQALAVASNGSIILAGATTTIYGPSAFVVLSVADGDRPTLSSPSSLSFDVASTGFGAGQLIQGTNNAFDGLNRLQVAGVDFSPSGAATASNNVRTVVTGTQMLSGLNVHREITVPNTGSQDFARTVDYFQNPGSTPITTTVHIVGNLGSDAATQVFATSSGDSTPSTSDEWVGTDGGPGTTVVISISHGPEGLVPTSEDIVGDNIEWTYSITVQPGQTIELGTFTIQASSEANAITEANALVTSNGFGGQAAEFLSNNDLAALANFQSTGPLTYTATTGSPTSYTLRLDGTGTNVQVVDGNNNVLASMPLANTTGVSITGHAGGSDTLTLDFSNGYFSFPGGISFNGGGSGTLNTKGGTFVKVTDNLTGPGAGNLVYHPSSGADLTLTYSGLLPVSTSGNSSDFVINLPAGVTDAKLAAGPAGMETISSTSNAFESTTFADPTNSLTINGTAGAAEGLTINALNASFTASLIVDLKGNSGSGTDLVTINGALTLSGGLTIDAQTTDLNNTVSAASVSGTATIVNVASPGSIQTGIDLAASGATVNVAAGTYNELVVVDKTVTLLGAQHGVDARTRSSVPESIVSNSEGDFQVEADNVVIDGFTLEGVTSDPNVDSGSLGVAIWTNPGASSTHGGTQILNNIITGNIGGIELNNDGTYQSKVQYNLFQDNTQPGAASGLDITVDFGLSSALIDSNTFTNTSFVENAWALAVEPTSPGSSNITFSNNTVTNHGRGAFFYTTTGAAVTGNSITGASHYGIGIFGFNSYPANASFTISTNTLNVNGSGGAGVEVLDDTTPGFAYTGTLTLSGDSITTSGADVSIDDESATPIDATAEKFNTILASSGSTAFLFGVEDTIIDAIDVSGFGLVRLKAGNVYVTPNSFFTPDGTTTPDIQRGVAVASSGDTIHVEAGTTYLSNLVLNKSLSVIGAGSASTSFSAGSGVGATLSGGAGVAITLQGLAITGSSGSTGINSSGVGTLNLTDVASSTTHGGTFTGTTGTVNLTAAGGTSVSGDASARTFATGVLQPISFGSATLSNLNLGTLGNNNAFSVKPVTGGATTIAVDGGTPFPPGSTLSLDLSAVSSPVINSSGPGAGSLSTTPAATPLSWVHISNVSASPAAATVITLTPGDNYHVFRSGTGNANLEIDDTSAATTVFDAAYSGVSTLTLNGTGAGTNQVNVDFASGADPIPTGGTFFNGVAMTSNVLEISNGTFTQITSTFTGAHAGFVTLDSLGTVHYTGLTPLLLNVGSVANVEFDLPSTFGGGQTFNDAYLEESGVMATPLQLRSNNGTFETTELTDPTSSLTIKTGTASDTLTVPAPSLPDLTSTLNVGTGVSPFATTTIGGTMNLSSGSLTVNAGTIDLGADVTTTETQTYNGPVTLSGTRTLTVSGAGNDVLFNAAVNATTNGVDELIVAAARKAVFGSTVGATIPLGSLSAGGARTIYLGGNVNTNKLGGKTGKVDLSGTTGIVLTASVTLHTGISGFDGGDLVLYGTPVSANAAGLDLVLDASAGAGHSGGQIVFSDFGNAGGAYVHDLTLNNAGGTGEGLILAYTGSINLDNNGASPAAFTIDAGSGSYVVAASSQTIDTEQGNDGDGGAVNLGTSTVSGLFGGFTLAINTSTTAAGKVAGNITMGPADVGVSTNTGDLILTATAAAAANDGDVSLTGALNLGTSGQLTATGRNISQTATAVITAGQLGTSSVTGTALNTATNAVASFTASNSSSGNISLSNAASLLTVTGITETGGGITVSNTGNVTTSGAVTDSTAGNALSLTATTGTLTLGAAVTGNTTDTISLNTVTSGNIAVNAAVSTGSGSITVMSAGNITETGSLSTSGLLSTSSATGTTLNGVNTVGSFTALNSTSGNVQLTNTVGTLSVTGITETGGGITVSNTGNLTTSGAVTDNTAGNALSLTATSGTLTLGAAVTGNTTDTISLNTVTSGNIAVNAAVTTGSGSITVTSAGNITETGSLSTSGLLSTSSATGTTLNGANTVGSFTALNSTSGNVQLTNTVGTLSVTGITETGGGITVGNTGNLTTSGAVTDSTAGNALSLTATAGTLTLGAAVTGNTTDTISLNTVTSGNIAVNAAVTTGSGSITVTSVGNITETGSLSTSGLLSTSSATGTTLNGANTVGSFTALNSTSGNVQLTNTVGTLNVTGITETGGGITVGNTGNLTTSGAVTDNTAGNALSLTATSGTLTLGATVTGNTTDTISLNTVTSGNIAVNAAVTTGSGSITVTSAGNITETGSFSTTGLLSTSSATGTTLNGGNAVGSFTATNSTNGAISLMNTSGTLTVTGITETPAANVSVTNSGNLTTSTAPIATGSGGNISLQATGGVLTLGAAVTAGGAGTVGLTATGTNSVLINAAVSSTSGNISATAGQNITFGAGGSIATGGAATVTLSASAAILNNNGANTDITSGSAALSAVTGIGDAAALKTAISNLAFHNTTSGNVQVSNSGGLTVSAIGSLTISTNGGGGAVLSAHSPVTYAVNTFATFITATAVDSPTLNSDNVTVNSGVLVWATSGDVTFQAGDNIVVQATATVQANANILLASGYNDSDGEGNMQLNGTLQSGTGTSRIELNVGATQGATQGATGTFHASHLLLLGTGTSGSFTLNNSTTNQVAVLAASTAAFINYHDVGTLTIGTAGSTAGINSGGSNVTVSSNGPMTIGSGAGEGITATGAIVDLSAGGITETATPTASTITAASLRLQGTVGFTLGQSNNVGTLAAAIFGPLVFNNGSNALTVGTVYGTAGINSNTNNVTLTTGGLLTIGSGAGEGITATGATVDLNAAGVTETATPTASTIAANSLRLQGTGTFLLADSNAVSTLAAATSGAVVFNNGSAALIVGSVLGTNGINTTNQDATLCSGPLTISQAINVGTANTVRLQSSGTISQSAAITAGTLGVNAGGTVTLTSAGNDVTSTFAATAAAAISFTDSVGFSTGQVAGSTCFTSTVNGVSTTAGNGTITLTATSGTLTVAATNGNVSANGSGSVTLLANSTATSDVAINGTVSSSTGPVSATAGRNVAFGTTGAVATSTSAALANVALTAASTGTITEAGTGTTVTGNALALSAGGGIGSSTHPILMNGAKLTATSAASSGNQYLADTATIQLVAANALNAGIGTITLTGGTFQITSGAAGNAITDTSPVVVNSPAVLDLNGNNETVWSLAGSGSVTLGSGTLTTGNSSGDSPTFSGVISGPGGVTKVGSDTFTLTGHNTYTGVTNVNGGTLTLGAGGFLNFGPTLPTGGAVNLNTAGVVFNGSGTDNGQVTVVASTFANPSQVQNVTVAVPAGGTGIKVQSGATFVQIGTTSGVTINGGNATSTGILVQGSALIFNDTVSGQHVGVYVNGGTAAIQGSNLSNDTAGSYATGLLAQNGAIVDAGQLAPSFTAPPAPNGYYGDITGLLGGGTHHSSGGNTFLGYTLDTTGTAGGSATLFPGSGVPQAIRDLNTGTAPFSAVFPEQSNNYGAAGPQLGRMDLLAQGNTFGTATTVTQLFQIEQLIYHDIDNNALGFVTYGTSTAASPVVVGSVQYSANFNLSALQGGTSTLVAGQPGNVNNGQKSSIRYIEVTFSSYVFLDPDLQSATTNRGLNLLKVTGPYGASAGTLVTAGIASTVYNQSNGNYTVIYSLSGPATEFASLQDGTYTLQFNESAIQGGGPGGPSLSSAGDPYAAAAAQFFRYYGDTNGDDRVDNVDLAAIQQALNSHLGQANYRAYLDFGNVGSVTSADYSQFLKRYKTAINPLTGAITIITP